MASDRQRTRTYRGDELDHSAEAAAVNCPACGESLVFLHQSRCVICDTEFDVEVEVSWTE